MDNLDLKVYDVFNGKVVKKGATKKIKGSANVPTYVLEYLLGNYCLSDNENKIQEGIEQVKKILAKNYVRRDEAELVKSKIKESGSYTIIDTVICHLDEHLDIYLAYLQNLDILVEIHKKYINNYPKLLTSGIWCRIALSYFYDANQKKLSPFSIDDLTPIQIPNIDLNEFKIKRSLFTKDEWIDLILRSIGFEPSTLEYEVKWHLITRLIPLAENNINLCELGPRGTGKSYVYKEISPNSILMSGGQTTVANLFYNLAKNAPGLVMLWDCVAFDEVAGIKFKDNNGIQIMKDYMASGSFARGKNPVPANASLVFVGNINQSVSSLVKSSHLFAPFPTEMIDAAFFDRMHIYIPGWEIPKTRPEHFTENYGFITDYFAEVLRELRKIPQTDAFDKYFKLGIELNQRDTIAVRKTLSGLVKILYPDNGYNKQQIEEILKYALTTRRRIKEQLKKIGGMEFYETRFSYIDLETNEEHFVRLKELGGDKIIPEGNTKPGTVYSVGNGKNNIMGIFKLETQISEGNGKFNYTGLSNNKDLKESIKIAENYFKANYKAISSKILIDSKNYFLDVTDCNGIELNSSISIGTLIAYCSAALNLSVKSELAIIGSFSISGSIDVITDLASYLQVCNEAGAKKILLPSSCVSQITSVPSDLFAVFTIIFYKDPLDAVTKAIFDN